MIALIPLPSTSLSATPSLIHQASSTPGIIDRVHLKAYSDRDVPTTVIVDFGLGNFLVSVPGTLSATPLATLVDGLYLQNGQSLMLSAQEDEVSIVGHVYRQTQQALDRVQIIPFSVEDDFAPILIGSEQTLIHQPQARSGSFDLISLFLTTSHTSVLEFAIETAPGLEIVGRISPNLSVPLKLMLKEHVVSQGDRIRVSCQQANQLNAYGWVKRLLF